MKASYEMTLKLNIIHDIDSLEDLKGDREYAEDVCKMICDEAMQADAVICYEILKSSMEVKETH